MADDEKPQSRDALGRYLPNHDLGGGPSHRPTKERRRLVELAARLGGTHDQIGAALRISDVSLRKHYGPELARAKLAVHAAIAATYLRRMLGGGSGMPGDEGDWRQASTPMLIHYAKCRLGWREGGNDNGAGGMGPDFIDI
jgi:hypothetical protein